MRVPTILGTVGSLLLLGIVAPDRVALAVEGQGAAPAQAPGATPKSAPPAAPSQPPLGVWVVRESCKNCNVVMTAELFLQRYSTAEETTTLANSGEGRCAETVRAFPSLGGLMAALEIGGQQVGSVLVPNFATARLVGGLWRISVTAGGSTLRAATPETPFLLELSLDRSGNSGTGRMYRGTTISCLKGAVAAVNPLEKPVAVTVRRKK